ncbi:MAG: VOC family protein [Solirubrobacterales bacterium]|nr:VOC family protein [Solirubrobacterales bacterium]
MSLSESKIAAVAAVGDMDRAKRFYEESLGLDPADSGAEGTEVLYACGDGTGLLVYPSPEHAGKATATIAAWEVEDFDAETSSLKEHGISFEKYDGFDQDDDGVMKMGDMRVVWFTDPDGNTFALSGPCPGASRPA